MGLCLAASAVFNLGLIIYMYLLIAEQTGCVRQDGWLTWLNDRSPWKAFHDIQSIGNNQWVRMLAPDLSLHSRSVIQGVGCTLGSCCLCLAATRFPHLQPMCTVLYHKLTSTQYPHIHTHTLHIVAQ